MHALAVRALVPLEDRPHGRLRPVERMHELDEVEIEPVVERQRRDRLGQPPGVVREQRRDDVAQRHDRNAERAELREIVRERHEVVGRVVVAGDVAGVVGEDVRAHQNGGSAAMRAIRRCRSGSDHG